MFDVSTLKAGQVYGALPVPHIINQDPLSIRFLGLGVTIPLSQRFFGALARVYFGLGLDAPAVVLRIENERVVELALPISWMLEFVLLLADTRG